MIMCHHSINHHKNDNNHNQLHLFHKDLTASFYESCSTFLRQGNTSSPCRRLFNDDDSDHLDDDGNGDQSNNQKDIHIPFLNLVYPDENDFDTCVTNAGTLLSQDPWMQSAIQLSIQIHDQNQFLIQNYIHYTKQYKVLDIYNDKNNNNDEDNDDLDNYLDSKLVSFMTTTTKQIEKLRLQNNNTQHQQQQQNVPLISHTIYHHRNGIIANLYSDLKHVMNQYSKMQSLRNRHSLMIIDDPLKVCFPIIGIGNTTTTSKQSGNQDEDSDEGGENGSEFGMHSLPMLTVDSDAIINGNNDLDSFMIKYNLTNKAGEKVNIDNAADDDVSIFYNDSDEALIEVLNQPLPSLTPPTKSANPSMIPKGGTMTEHSTDTISITTTKQNVIKNNSTYNEYYMASNDDADNANNNTQQEQLRQETILLVNKVQNESLDSVHKVESQMIQITSLLNQFTSLISDQQVEIDVIHENTIKSKDNVEMGSEQLLKAKESKKRSRHYFAWIIVLMGLLLLFLNAIIP